MTKSVIGRHCGLTTNGEVRFFNQCAQRIDGRKASIWTYGEYEAEVIELRGVEAIRTGLLGRILHEYRLIVVTPYEAAQMFVEGVITPEHLYDADEGVNREMNGPFINLRRVVWFPSTNLCLTVRVMEGRRNRYGRLTP